MPNIFGNNNVAPPGVPIPPGPMGPQGPQGPPGPAAIQEEGISLPARGYLNFVGSGVTAADDAAHNRVTVTVTGGGGGATPGGPVTSIQVNDAGALAGYPALTYDGATLAGGQIQCTAVNPTTANNPQNRRAWDLNVTTDALNTSPNFADSNAVQIGHTIAGGYYNADATIQNKTTSIAVNVGMIATGASQAFCLALSCTKDSMGDAGLMAGTLHYRGGPLAGDEGVGFHPFMYVAQDTSIIVTNIVSVRRSACPASMTVTQAVTASQNPQTVNVSATTGLTVNDWLVAGQSADTCNQHIRAIQVISFTATTITAVIAVNMASGDSLKAALVLGISVGRFGQLVPLVNLSGVTYQTGTVSSISGGNFTGTGTAWAANVVGGDSLNIGAISLIADNVTDDPFDATPTGAGGHMLRSWYQIWSVSGASQLAINSFSAAGDRAYRGYGPGSGGYLIKPAARVLWIPDSGTAVCEYSAHVWNVGDMVESIIVPYPDVSLQQWNMSAYTPGGTYRGAIAIINGGHETFDTGFRLYAAMKGHDAPWGWGSGLDLSACQTGITIRDPRDTSITIFASDPTHNANIKWQSGIAVADMGLSGNLWDPGQLTITAGSGRLDFVTEAVTGGFCEMRWHGSVTISPPNNSDNVFYQIAVDMGPALKEGRTVGTRQLRGFRMEGAMLHADANLYFRFIDDQSGYSAQVFGIANGISGPGNWRGSLTPSRGTATASQNFGSYDAVFVTSVWHAGAPQQQSVVLRAEPESDGVDSHNRLCAYIWSTAGGYTSVANRALSVNDVGKLSIGSLNPFIGGGFMATFDPTGITGGRTLVVPDASGTIALAPATSSFSVFPTDTLPPVALDNSQEYSFGYSFQVRRSLIVTGLSRVYHTGNSQDHYIGLWNKDTHILMASGTILNATASDSNNIKAVTVPAVLLFPGVNYVIGVAEHAGGDMHKQDYSLAGLTSSPIIPGYSMFAGAGEPVGQNQPGHTLSSPAINFTEALMTGLATFDGTGLTAPRTITIPDASGTMVLTPLPSASPGSGKLWYDPADSNRVKYTP